jgi:hypothetical protein
MLKDMKHFKLLVLATSFIALSFPLASQDRGSWSAKSSTARTITGEILIGADRISISLLNFPIAQVRALKPDELRAAFDTGPDSAGNLYRVNIAATQRFLQRNTLCGTEDTLWMATGVEGKTLHVAFFSNSKTPVFTFESLNNAPDLCGTFTYTR